MNESSATIRQFIACFAPHSEPETSKLFNDNRLSRPAFLIAGVVDTDSMLNFTSTDAALQTFIKGKLNGGDGTDSLGAPFIFDDKF